MNIFLIAYEEHTLINLFFLKPLINICMKNMFVNRFLNIQNPYKYILAMNTFINE